MSRYALEWAKQRRVGTAEAKVVLLLLADRSASHRHRATYLDAELLDRSGLSAAQLAHAVGVLVGEGLVTVLPSLLYMPYGPATRYELQIPKNLAFGRVTSPTLPPELAEQRTAVYRLFAADGDLLYVGVANDPPERFGQHARKHEWWRDVVTRDVEWYPTRQDAESVECRAIVEEKPRYNRSHSRDAVWFFGRPGEHGRSAS